MNGLPWHPSQGPYVDVFLEEFFPPPVDDELPDLDPRLMHQRADCCIAGAAYRVVLPASAEREEPGELLLCGHHMRSSQPGLARVHAAIFDARNRLVSAADGAPAAP